MLYSWSSIVINKFLNLRFLSSFSRFSNSEFDNFIKISNYSWSKSRILSVHCVIINWIELMEVKHLFIPFSSWLHLKGLLICSHMINFKKVWLFNDVIERFCEWWNLESRKEGAWIINVLDESMPSISVSLNCRDDHWSVFILNFSRRHDWLCSSWNCSWICLLTVFNWKSNISYSITMLFQILSKLIISWI